MVIFLFFDGGVRACAVGTLAQWPVQAGPATTRRELDFAGDASAPDSDTRANAIRKTEKFLAFHTITVQMSPSITADIRNSHPRTPQILHFIFQFLNIVWQHFDGWNQSKCL